MLARLEQEFDDSGRGGSFDQLKGSLLAEEPDLSYAELSARLSMTESAVKQAVHRMRFSCHLLRGTPQKESERTRTDLYAYEKDNLAFDPDDVGLPPEHRLGWLRWLSKEMT